MQSAREVAYFTSYFLPPSEIFMVEQARHLTRYTSRFLATQRQESKTANQHSMRLNCLSDSWRGQMAAAELRLARWVDPLFRELIQNAAILHAQFGKNGYLAWPIARRLSMPFVTTFHGYDATFVGNPLSVDGVNQRLFFWRGRAQMARAGLNCIAVSDYIRDRLLELGFPKSKIFRHYIGINTNLFCPEDSVERVANRVVCISRFVEYKGHRFIIDALTRLTKGGVPIELIMVGQGPLRNEIERAARKGIAKVTVLQDQSQSEIISLLRTAQLYIHGSYRTPTGHAEALGLSILEAEAVGTPVIAFDSGGVGEAVDNNKTGYLVPEKDVVGMSKKIAMLLADFERWNSFSRAGVDFVRTHFDITKCCSQLEDIYDNIIDMHVRDRSC